MNKMGLEAYSVYDKAVGAFLPPVFVRSRGEMIRSFTDAVNSKEHQFNRHCSDYTLYFLGMFDDDSGMIESADPVRVVSALEVLVPEEPFTEANRLRSV